MKRGRKLARSCGLIMIYMAILYLLAETPLNEKTCTSYNLCKKPILITQADGTKIHHFYNKNGTLEKTVYADGMLLKEISIV
jgi:hypothetical protein